MKDEYLKIIKEKGEIDFEVSTKILTLTLSEFNELRQMLIVAIGTMEDMWRNTHLDLESFED